MRNMPTFAMSKTYKRYEAANIAAFFVPIHIYSFEYKDITAPCRELETTPKLCL